MSKHRAGLQKQISAIFKGVPVQKDTPPRPPGAPEPQYPTYPQQPEPDKPLPEQPPVATEPPAPEPPAATTTKTYQPPAQPPAQIPPKTAPTKQPKAAATVKAIGKIPWQKTLDQIKNKLFKPKPGTSHTRQKAVAISVPVLFIILIFVFIQVLNVPSRKTAGARQFGPSNTATASTHEINWQIPGPYPTTLRDPMQLGSASATHTGTDGLAIKGIVYSEDDPTAIIGTKIVRQGDKISGVTVTKINQDSVEFETNDGKKWTQKVQR